MKWRTTYIFLAFFLPSILHLILLFLIFYSVWQYFVICRTLSCLCQKCSSKVNPASNFTLHFTFHCLDGRSFTIKSGLHSIQVPFYVYFTVLELTAVVLTVWNVVLRRWSSYYIRALESSPSFTSTCAELQSFSYQSLLLYILCLHGNLQYLTLVCCVMFYTLKLHLLILLR
jgi:hypothetical protein